MQGARTLQNMLMSTDLQGGMASLDGPLVLLLLQVAGSQIAVQLAHAFACPQLALVLDCLQAQPS